MMGACDTWFGDIFGSSIYPSRFEQHLTSFASLLHADNLLDIQPRARQVGQSANPDYN